MAIKIKVDKESEYAWLRKVLDCGCFYLDKEDIELFKRCNIPTKQNITYDISEIEYDVDWEKE